MLCVYIYEFLLEILFIDMEILFYRLLIVPILDLLGDSSSNNSFSKDSPNSEALCIRKDSYCSYKANSSSAF